MHRFFPALLLLTLILGACSPSPSLLSTETAPAPTISLATEPATLTPVGDINCGYQWAYQDLPEVSAQFDQAVKDLIPNSNSHATAFGENCIGADNQVVTFLAMETDFYVIAPVGTLEDHQSFGNWAAGVMQVVNNLPTEMLAGPMPGFVEFRFEKDTSESLILRIPIQQYRETAEGKIGEELFDLFYTKP